MCESPEMQTTPPMPLSRMKSKSSLRSVRYTPHESPPFSFSAHDHPPPMASTLNGVRLALSSRLSHAFWRAPSMVLPASSILLVGSR